jgi:hypothetical protein
MVADEGAMLVAATPIGDPHAKRLLAKSGTEFCCALNDCEMTVTAKAMTTDKNSCVLFIL